MNKIQFNKVKLNTISLNTVGEVLRKVKNIVEDLWEEVILKGISILFLENAMADSITSVKVNGGARQSGTPTPTTPYSIISNKGAIRYAVLGNNMLDVKKERLVLGKYLNNNGEEVTSTANFYIAQFIKVKAGVDYTASFSTSIGYFSFMEYDANFTFLKRTLYGESGKKITSCTHTMGSDTAYVVVGSNPTSAQVTEDYVLSHSWMLNEGSTALPYEAYNAGITYDGEDSMRVGSINLNDGVLEHKGYTSTGGESTSTTFCGTLHKFRVIAGQKYTVSFGNFPDGVSGVFINSWLIDGSWNIRQAISASNKLTYTIPDNVGWVNFTLYKTGGITIGADSWMQVEHGTEATDYQPYAMYSSALAENLMSIDEYVDEQEIVKGIVTRKVGIKVFDGTEKISLSSGTYNYGIVDKLKSASPLLCTHYPYTSASSSAAADKTIKSYSSVNVGFKDSSFATVADFNEFLAQEYAKGTPVMVVYPLIEEVVENVAPQPFTNPEGSHYIIRSSGVSASEMEVVYKKKVVAPAPEPEQPEDSVIEYHWEIPMEEKNFGFGISYYGELQGDYSDIVNKLKAFYEENQVDYEVSEDIMMEKTNITVNEYRMIGLHLDGDGVYGATTAPKHIMVGDTNDLKIYPTYIAFEYGTGA